MGIVSLEPLCTRKACCGDSSKKLPCNPCYAVPCNKTLCKWMREERNADSSMEHFQLGFLNSAKRANVHRADKNTAIKALCRVSDVCEALLQKCHAHKATQVNGKDLMRHMAFHIGRGKAVGVCPPCLFCGHRDGTCRLQMSKAWTGDAHWQIAPTSCAHHCYHKTNMASV